MKAISQELQPLLSIAAAVFDSAGILLEANAGFTRLLGTRARWRIGTNAAACFRLPDFKELAGAQALVGGDVFFGTMQFDDGSGGTIEMRGRVWRSAFGLCVLAEPGVDTPALAGAAGPPEANARRQAQGQLKAVSAELTDKLTGTGNRARLDEAFAAELTRVQRTGLPLGVLIAVADRFAELADKYGQGGTDKLLARCGFLLRLLTRPTDIVTRYGTEEFAVLLPHTNLAQAVSAAERIRKVFEKDLIEPLSEPATVSFGVAEYRSGEDLSGFLRRAGAARREA